VRGNKSRLRGEERRKKSWGANKRENMDGAEKCLFEKASAAETLVILHIVYPLFGCRALELLRGEL